MARRKAASAEAQRDKDHRTRVALCNKLDLMPAQDVENLERRDLALIESLMGRLPSTRHLVANTRSDDEVDERLDACLEHGLVPVERYQLLDEVRRLAVVALRRKVRAHERRA